MKIKIIIATTLAVTGILFTASCAKQQEWFDGTSYTSYENADLEQCLEIPEYIASDLPDDLYTADDIANYPETSSYYRMLMDNYEEFGRYDGLAACLFGCYYFPVSDNSGYLMKHYGVNQSTRQNKSEVYYYADGEYTLIDSTGDSYSSCAAICDGSNLYYLLSDGALRCISQSGEKTDHENVIDASEYDINFLSLTGSGNVIEIYSYDDTVVGRIELG